MHACFCSFVCLFVCLFVCCRCLGVGGPPCMSQSVSVIGKFVTCVVLLDVS